MLVRIHSLSVRLARLVAYVGVLCLSGAMLVTIADILLRVVSRGVNLFVAEPIGLAVAGVVDIVQLLVMAVAFLAIPFAFLRDSHVTVDILTSRFRPRHEAFLKALGTLLSVWFLYLVFRHGWDQMQNQIMYGDTSMTLAIPYLWYWTPLLIGVALAILATGLLAILHFAFVLTGDPGLDRRREGAAPEL